MTYRKIKKLEELSDKLHETMNDIRRDLFKHKLHYVLNGIQSLVDQRRSHLTMHADKGKDDDGEDTDDNISNGN